MNWMLAFRTNLTASRNTCISKSLDSVEREREREKERELHAINFPNIFFHLGWVYYFPVLRFRLGMSLHNSKKVLMVYTEQLGKFIVA